MILKGNKLDSNDIFNGEEFIDNYNSRIKFLGNQPSLINKELGIPLDQFIILFEHYENLENLEFQKRIQKIMKI